jgi:two-component system, OmpR family, response regulator MprA
MTTPRILVVDDDREFTRALARMLSYRGYEVDAANSGQEALEAALRATPNLAILDVMMPDIEGTEVCRRLRQMGERFPIIMLTARDAVTDRVSGLDAGADDYVVKPPSMEELLARVRAHLRRAEEDTEDVLSFADLRLDTRTREASRGDRTIPLSTTQYDLLRLFMTHPRQVLTRDVLMDRVWGYDFEGESNVLEAFVRQLRQKLEEQGEPRLIHTVRGAGYVLKE